MKRYQPLLISLAIALHALLANPALAVEPVAPATDVVQQERVVYHVDDINLAREAIANVMNHIKASPGAKIVLVANGKGIPLLVSSDNDKPNEHRDVIQELQSKGVRFIACRNSLNARNIDQSRVLPGIVIVPAGVVEITRLQVNEKYAYIKP